MGSTSPRPWTEDLSADEQTDDMASYWWCIPPPMLVGVPQFISPPPGAVTYTVVPYAGNPPAAAVAALWTGVRVNVVDQPPAPAPAPAANATLGPDLGPGPDPGPDPDPGGRG